MTPFKQFQYSSDERGMDEADSCTIQTVSGCQYNFTRLILAHASLTTSYCLWLTKILEQPILSKNILTEE